MMIDKLLLAILLLLVLMQCSLANWEFELKLLNYSNPKSEAVSNSDTKCCDPLIPVPQLPIPQLPPSCNLDRCDNIFNFQLSPITCLPCRSLNLSCSYGNYRTAAFTNSDSFEFDETIPAAATHSVASNYSNPLTFSGEEWPMNGVLVLSVYVDDYDSLSKNDFVDLLVATIPVSPTPFNEFSVVKHIAGYYNYSFLSISYRMKCASGYHGSTCSDTNSTDNIPATTPTVASKTNGKDSISCTFSAVGSLSTDSKVVCSSVSHATTAPTGSVFSASIVAIIILIMISAALAVTVLICGALVCLLRRKVRRKSCTARRPLPPVPLTISSTHNNVEMHDCPAYTLDRAHLITNND